MGLSGGRVSNTWITCPGVGDSLQKCGIIPQWGYERGSSLVPQSFQRGKTLEAHEEGSAAD